MRAQVKLLSKLRQLNVNHLVQCCKPDLICALIQDFLLTPCGPSPIEIKKSNSAFHTFNGLVSLIFLSYSTKVTLTRSVHLIRPTYTSGLYTPGIQRFHFTKKLKSQPTLGSWWADRNMTYIYLVDYFCFEVFVSMLLFMLPREPL